MKLGVDVADCLCAHLEDPRAAVVKFHRRAETAVAVNDVGCKVAHFLIVLVFLPFDHRLIAGFALEIAHRTVIARKERLFVHNQHAVTGK